MESPVSGMTFVAGQNISITGSSISCTYQPEAEQPYVGGNGIAVLGGPYTISTIDNLRMERNADEPTETQNDTGEGQVLRSGTGDVVSITGGLNGILSGLGGLFGGAAGSASSAIGAIGGLSGAVTGGSLAGGWLAIFGRERREERDSNGVVVTYQDGTPKLLPGSNVVIGTLPDNGCDATRLLFDTPPDCSWLGVKNEYSQQAVNLDILRRYDSEIIVPRTVDSLDPIVEKLDYLEAVTSDIEANVANNYQTKITSLNPIPYGVISGSPDFSVYLNRNTDLSSINTSIATKQNIISTSNRLDYSLLSNIPNLSLKQDPITTTNKLPYSLLSGAPDLSLYLNRTTDLSSITSSIAGKVSQSVYDSRQTVLDTASAAKQSNITHSLTFSGVDNVSTTVLNETFTTTPTGTLSGNAVYDSANKYWTVQADLFYSSFRQDEGIQLLCQGWNVWFSGYFNYTRITAPDSSIKEVGPSLPRDTWATVRLTLSYDKLEVYVNGTLVTSHTNGLTNVPAITNILFAVYGYSGGFGTEKRLDNLSLVQNSNATEYIQFAPFNSRVSSSSGTLQECLRINSTGRYRGFCQHTDRCYPVVELYIAHDLQFSTSCY
ncbi:hypothetical protein DFS34DRAFT_297104 [Phlyctochytrium arcticum]|nr:hypothetical protein DFS34DRAFT_297104 [Phlyctochytrium arcticum]